MKGRKVICLIVLIAVMVVNLGVNAIANNFAKVSGTLSYPQLSTALIQEAIIYITILDVSPLQDSSGNVISRVTIAKPTQSPVYFELKYNPAQINQGHIYAVQAHVANQGKVVLTNSLPYLVITCGNPHKVDIVLKNHL